MNEKLELQESRYDRAERITWWDQGKLLSSKVLVVGAGALGNEIIKNFSMLGIGEIHVVDMDEIEHSNLARCVFFREEDEGSNKATTLAKKASEVNPDVKVVAHPFRVQQLGSAFLAGFEVIVGALDNREARLWVNAAARRLGVTWIDGAIEGIQGLVRTFPPEGPCYECTLGEVDWQILNHRKSCSLLSPEAILSGKTPTNTTTASIIAGVQSQEVVKILVGRSDLSALNGKTWHYLGESLMAFVSEITEDEYCNAHVGPLSISETFTNPKNLAEVVARFEQNEISSVEFFDDFITINSCPTCSSVEVNGLRSLLVAGQGKCISCDSELTSSTKTRMSLDDPILTKPFSDLIWSMDELVLLNGKKSFAIAIKRGK